MAVVGLFGPDNLFDEKSQRGAEVGDDILIETGEGFEVFAEVIFFGEVEPGEEEAVSFSFERGSSSMRSMRWLIWFSLAR